MTSASPCGRSRPERSPEAPRRVDVGPIPDAADSRPVRASNATGLVDPTSLIPTVFAPVRVSARSGILGPCQAPDFGDTLWLRPTSCARGAKTSGSLGLDTAYDRGWAKVSEPLARIAN